MNKTIFHIDVNSAFLSWTAVKRLKDDPLSLDLRSVPSVVGGDVKTRHGIVTAKSIPAKKYGIQTAEPINSALSKCPKLIIVPSDFHTYREYSHAFIDILGSYSEVLQQVSIDEAFIDVTELANLDVTDHLKKVFLAEDDVPFCVEMKLRESAEAGEIKRKEILRQIESDNSFKEKFPLNLAAAIRFEIFNRLGFTVNVGISNNKLLAKMASDFAKPDKTHTLYPSEVPDKMWPLDIGDLFGCGKKTSERLRSIGIKTIGDAAHYDPVVLMSQLGEKSGAYIFQSANGKGSDIVHTEREEAKSYSNETTTSNDITFANYEIDMPPIVRRLSEKVSMRMKRDGVYGGTVSVQVKTSDFKRFSRQMRLSDSSNDADIIYSNAMNLFENLLTGENGLFENDIHIRLVGVGMDHLDHGEYRQGNLFDWMTTGKEELKVERQKKEKADKLDKMENLIKNKFGDDAIHKGL
ncbi:MAG: DNA polymerase IV [Butyrivibrio sp.]|nr:DNA polymerase IV [Butyrivibrio sp.]